MITEKEALEWANALYSNMLYMKERFIEEGKKKGFIQKPFIELAREAVNYFNSEIEPYTIVDDKVYNKEYIIKDPKILLIQDLNRIVHLYEKAYKEIQKNK